MQVNNGRTCYPTIVALVIVPFLLLAGCGGGGGSGGSNSDNLAPTAIAGQDRNVDEGSVVTLDGSQSSDSDGTIESYAWSQISGPAVTLNNADSSIASYTAPEVTNDTRLTFRIRVTDDDGAKASDEVEHTVINVNALPVADAGPDEFVPEQTLVTLDGSQSSDSDGQIVNYAWSQVSGPTVVLDGSATPTATFTAPVVTNVLTFQLTVTDNDGETASDLVSISVAKILFSDDFSNGDLNSWTRNVVNDSGVDSLWVISNDEYRQSNYVQDSPTRSQYEESYHVGTFSYPGTVTNWSSWTSYRLSVEVTPLPNNSQSDVPQGNDVGVMFRYQDKNNYYRLSFSSRYGFSRLEKKVNGTFSTLAVDSRGYYEEVPLNVTLEINGSLIQVFVDQEPLFSVLDSEINYGIFALYCQDAAKFDNVLVTENSRSPMIVISSPVAYSVVTTDLTGDPNTLAASAITANMPVGGAVEFVIDDTMSIIDSVFPYNVHFSNVSQGEHKLDAILRDGSGSELARDTNDVIGIMGDYYVAMGDSITNGVSDKYSSDNVSLDGRTIAIQGFETNLNDLLTNTLAYPHVVFNEGNGGDSSADWRNERVDSVLARHPNVNKALILLGTIDSGGGTSNVDYRSNMQDLVDNIVADGKEVWVALIPPIFNTDGTPNTTRNQTIQGYNGVIASQLANIQVGPDFFNYFLGSGNNRSSLFADTLHPNGLGYAVMASLWHNVLVGAADPFQLPFIVLDSLTPLKYKQNLLEVGDEYYIDASFTLTEIPAVLDEGIWVMTANADGFNTSANFISFEVDRSVTVYVAYDAGAGTLPSWLSSLGFNSTGLQVGTTNGSLSLYSRNYVGSSTITLGGNRADGGTGTTNYVVAVVEN